MERVSNFKFLGVTVAEDLTWKDYITSAVRKAQQRLFFLRKLKWARLPQALLVNFYHCAVESVLTWCGFPAAPRQTGRPYTGWWKLHGGLLGPPSQRSPQSSPPAANAVQRTFYRTSSILQNTCSSLCPLVGDTDPLDPKPADWPTAYIHTVLGFWMSNLPATPLRIPSLFSIEYWNGLVFFALKLWLFVLHFFTLHFWVIVYSVFIVCQQWSSKLNFVVSCKQWQ